MIDSDYRILLEIDEAAAFDYENAEKAKYSHQDVKKFIVDEILDF